MSWAEVKKINSNFVEEPLNYNNYLSDIGVHGANAYIFQKYSNSAFLDFAINSLALWGNALAKQYLYDRLTSENVDYIFDNCPRIGDFLNARAGMENFNSGNSEMLLRNMTTARFNLLEEKFKEGLKRYISRKTQGNNVGEWLRNVFNKPEFSGKNTMANVLSDGDLWTRHIQADESIMWLLSHSTSAAVFTGSSSIPANVYSSFIGHLVKNEDNMVYFFEKLVTDNRIDNFFSRNDLCSAVVAQPTGIRAIIRVAKAFESFVQNPTASNKIVNNSSLENELFQGVLENVKLEKILREAKLDVSSLKSNLSYVGTQTRLNDRLRDSHVKTDTMISSVEFANSSIDLSTTSVNVILNAMLRNSILFRRAVQHTNTFVAWVNNSTAMQAVANSSTAMQAVANNSTAMQAVANSSTAMQAVANNSTALKVVLLSREAVLKIAGSETALSRLENSPYLQSRRASNGRYSNTGRYVILKGSGNSYSDSYAKFRMDGGWITSGNFDDRGSFMRMYPGKYATEFYTDSESDDTIWYFNV